MDGADSRVALHGDVVLEVDMSPQTREAFTEHKPLSAATCSRNARQDVRDMVQRPPAGTIPDTPGSYQFKDAAGRVIYVG